jgi:3-hydroxybutyryl-CoA dehydratase
MPRLELLLHIGLREPRKFVTVRRSGNSGDDPSARKHLSKPIYESQIMDLGPALGASASFSKTVGESDVYLFAGITGDLAPNHVNEQFMQSTQYRRRIAHGALLVGYMSTTSSIINSIMAERSPSIFPVSLGYDRVRFLKPVFIGDTITVHYHVDGIDEAKNRTLASVQVINQKGEVVAAAVHLMTWLPRQHA